MTPDLSALQPATTPGAKVRRTPDGHVVLQLPPGPPGRYRLAQLDDYRGHARARFPWQPPLTLAVRARASHKTIPGTWGFGLWNDPLSLSLGFGGERRLPALPNAVWFFFASLENHLALRDDLPGNGALAATFRSPALPAWLLAPGALALPLLFFRPAARRLRRAAAQLVGQDAAALDLDPTQWHDYAFDWQADHAAFRVDGQTVFQTPVSPRGRLGLVIWLDNQFAAWKPDGRLAWGVLGWEEEGWVEVSVARTATG